MGRVLTLGTRPVQGFLGVSNSALSAAETRRGRLSSSQQRSIGRRRSATMASRPWSCGGVAPSASGATGEELAEPFAPPSRAAVPASGADTTDAAGTGNPAGDGWAPGAMSGAMLGRGSTFKGGTAGADAGCVAGGITALPGNGNCAGV